jgi:hypothetical protein
MKEFVSCIVIAKRLSIIARFARKPSKLSSFLGQSILQGPG